ncbi:Crp/Fnr family transcriptional regulator [Pseudanabaena sp. FACHB-1998]|uniref:Crp/Fnr family transcriptional regulator n=1 Tax=Pseudanabaena sp. FACHB-1998 TaxID=2692858 RepID=UPI001680A20F|nr:Crp/Fnr family transcriptional regulator [Pseudanabaena sp. FACHB-1998]MBD2176805.1 Crp/Fnr family transcriptional regulator [Pseudanabaena sp. FACHB-1998]
MLNKIDLSNWLQNILIFQGLAAEQLIPLAQIAQLQNFKKDETIFHQGSEATGFFIVQIGRVKVIKTAANGKEHILHLLTSGDYFAEVATFDGKAFPASAIALEDTELIFFPRLAFLDLLHQYPAIAINMLTSLATRARKLAQMVEDLSFKEVPQRLAAYLLDVSDRANGDPIINLDVTKTQLASILGTISATLSRAFLHLSDAGLIAIHGSQVELLDRDRLKDISN